MIPGSSPTPYNSGVVSMPSLEEGKNPPLPEPTLQAGCPTVRPIVYQRVGRRDMYTPRVFGGLVGISKHVNEQGCGLKQVPSPVLESKRSKNSFSEPENSRGARDLHRGADWKVRP